MGKVTLTLLSGVLQILYIHDVLANGCHKYGGSCCIECNPGFYLPKKCGPCIPCPPKGYTDKPNNQRSCDHCQRCEGIFLYKERCTSTSNAVCTCIPGKKCTDEKCTQCISDPCPAGQQLDGHKCMDCPLGTFNPGTEHKCKPWKNCTALGSVVIIHGNRISDVVCGGYIIKITESPTTSSAAAAITKLRTVVGPSPEDRHSHIIYIVVSSAVGLLLMAICIACRQKLTAKIKHMFQTIPKPVVKQTEEEEGCSCHYPEEERGGENEPMTLVA